MPLALSHCVATKSPNNVASTFFNTVHLLPKDVRFEYGVPNLFPCFLPGCHYHLTPVHPWSLQSLGHEGNYFVRKHLVTRLCAGKHIGFTHRFVKRALFCKNTLFLGVRKANLTFVVQEFVDQLHAIELLVPLWLKFLMDQTSHCIALNVFVTFLFSGDQQQLVVTSVTVVSVSRKLCSQQKPKRWSL